jgi:hypothetical protein
LGYSLNRPNAPLAIDFKDFNMETISNIAVKDDLEISGNINGNAIVKTGQSPLFLPDLIVDQFAFKKDTIGTLTIHVDNKAANTYNTSVSITGQDNCRFKRNL